MFPKKNVISKITEFNSINFDRRSCDWKTHGVCVESSKKIKAMGPRALRNYAVSGPAEMG